MGISMNKTILCIILALILVACKGAKMGNETVKLPSIDEISASAWQNLSQKKIYFGHQSVGENILEGINKVMRTNNSVKLNIVKTIDPELFNQPVFAHSSVGKNDDTDSKINGFAEFIQKGIGNKADIVFFKFCFWDIRRETDIKTVFNNYKTKLSELKVQYPKIKFVHFTVPLMAYSNGIKDKIKRTLNMEIGSEIDNIRRNELNEMIIKEYKGKEPVFDIAQVESTLPDGRRTSFSKNENKYYYLASEYTKDGGHLNEQGSKIVAEQLLIFLARLSE
jgi:hypothetical protein